MRHILLIITALLLSHNLFSQDEKTEKTYTINYVANIPKAPIGLSVAGYIKNTFFGVYLDAKIYPGESPEGEDYTGIITINESENEYKDSFRGEKQTSLSIIDLGITYAFTQNKNISVYAAGGIVTSKVYRKYYDPTHILSNDGKYFIEDESKSKFEANFTTGLIYIFKSGFTVQGGIDANPTGANIGLGYSF